MRTARREFYALPQYRHILTQLASRPHKGLHSGLQGQKYTAHFVTRSLQGLTSSQDQHQAADSTKCERHEAPQSAYVHLPFCKRRCYYCDFPIQAVGPSPDAPQVQSAMQKYVKTLCQEIEATESESTDGLRTIFFGGGTPSLIPSDLLAQILHCLHSKFRICEDAEISMEADPGTFTAESLRRYMDLKVNRFSVGIQAFQQEVLEQCGRSHGLADVWKAIEDVHKAGVTNWSLDLISGLPHTDLGAWRHSLVQALEAGSTHISVYDLQVEEKTKFGHLYTPGQFPLPSDDSTAAMFCLASEILGGAGMEHYEISSYAKPGHRCQHNQVYWSGASYHAFGLGAASYLKRRRFSRPRSMLGYEKWVRGLASERKDLTEDTIEDSASNTDELLDMVMLRLRLSDGLDLKSIEAKFGRKAAESIVKALSPHQQRGLVQQKSHTVSLKDPEGFLMSNAIISDIFAELDPD